MVSTHEWLLRRNCSLTPHQVGIAFGVQCILSFLIAAICTLHGVWHIFIFSALEMTAVGIAFLIYARHATDHEHIALTESGLLIEWVCAGKTEQIMLDPHWTHVAPPERYQDLIGLVSQGKRINIGRYIPGHKRKQFAKELQHQLLYLI
jgi:uncharacterized membrane protein